MTSVAPLQALLRAAEPDAWRPDGTGDEGAAIGAEGQDGGVVFDILPGRLITQAAVAGEPARRGVWTSEWHHAGVSYTGRTKNGTAHDHEDAHIQWADGSEYVGTIRSNDRHGEGTMKYANGSSYTGSWKDNLRHGTGEYVSVDDYGAPVVTYRGNWVRDRRSGEGFIIYHRSGNSYRGSWAEDKKCGKGRFVWAAKREVYDGEWDSDKPHGLGRYFWLTEKDAISSDIVDGTVDYSEANATRALRNFYHGEMRHGQRHGRGTFIFADGSAYSGEWRDNVKAGEAIYEYENGRAVESEFVNDGMVQSPELENQSVYLRLEGAEHSVFPNSRSAQDRAAELEELYLAIFRYRSLLSELYDFYSTPPNKRDKKEKKWTLTELSLSQLLMDAEIPSPVVPLGELIRLLELVPQSSVGREVSLLESGVNGRVLLFWEFCTFLALAAIHRFPAAGVAADSVDQLVRGQFMNLKYRHRPALQTQRNQKHADRLDALWQLSVPPAVTPTSAEGADESHAQKAEEDSADGLETVAEVETEPEQVSPAKEKSTALAESVSIDDRGNLYARRIPADILHDRETFELVEKKLLPAGHRLLSVVRKEGKVRTLQGMLAVFLDANLVAETRKSEDNTPSVEQICALWSGADGEFDIKTPIALYDVVQALFCFAVMSRGSGNLGKGVEEIAGKITRFLEQRQ